MMSIRNKRVVSKEDFGDLTQYSSLSRFDCLVIVAKKAYEKEKIAIITNSRKRNRVQSPVLPQEFKDRIFLMGGTDPTMAIQKKLFMCDVHKSHARLSMPESECGSKLSLTKEERELLEARDEKKLVGIKVKVIDPKLEERELCFKKWNANFVIVSGWNEVVANNKLCKGDDVQVWAFRVNGELAFAVVKLQESSN